MDQHVITPAAAQSKPVTLVRAANKAASEPRAQLQPSQLQPSQLQQALDLFALPFNDLLFQAQQVHRAHHDANAVQRSTLLSIKTGGCSEDCGYLPASGALSHKR